MRRATRRPLGGTKAAGSIPEENVTLVYPGNEWFWRLLQTWKLNKDSSTRMLLLLCRCWEQVSVLCFLHFSLERPALCSYLGSEWRCASSSWRPKSFESGQIAPGLQLEHFASLPSLPKLANWNAFAPRWSDHQRTPGRAITSLVSKGGLQVVVWISLEISTTRHQESGRVRCIRISMSYFHISA